MIVLVGFMGAGKTTVGHILAERLGTAVRRQRRATSSGSRAAPIVDVFAVEGEPHFRELEHRAINELVRGPDAVLALGGGALGDPRTRAILRNTTRGVPAGRLRRGHVEGRQDKFRPMLQRADLDQVYAAPGGYGEVAAVQVDTTAAGRTPSPWTSCAS